MGTRQRSTLVGLLVVVLPYALLTSVNYSDSYRQTSPIGRQLQHVDYKGVYPYHPTTSSSASVVRKSILIFGDYPEMLRWPELSVFLDILQQELSGKKAHGELVCPEHDNVQLKLTVSDNVDDFVGKDVVIFGLLAKSMKGRLAELLANTPRPSSDQLWVYYSTETPLMVKRWTEADQSQPTMSDMMYHLMMTYQSESEVHIPFGYYRYKRSKPSVQDRIVPQKSKLIYWMASNCDEVSWPRSAFVRELEQHLPLHTYGKCGSRQCLPVRSKRCFDLLDNYKFYLAIANGECREYITEKLWTNTLSFNTVPVVYGAKKEDFARLAPPHSFIHVSDFKDTQALADYLLELDRNDTKYRTYLEWKKTYEVVTTFPVAPNTLCHLIPYIDEDRSTRQHRKLKYIRDSKWYQGCRKDRNGTDLVNFMAQKEQNVNFKSWLPW